MRGSIAINDKVKFYYIQIQCKTLIVDCRILFEQDYPMPYYILN